MPVQFYRKFMAIPKTHLWIPHWKVNGSGWVQEARTPGGDWLVLQTLGHMEDALCERPEQKVYFQAVIAIKYFVGWTKDSNFGWNLLLPENTFCPKRWKVVVTPESFPPLLSTFSHLDLSGAQWWDSHLTGFGQWVKTEPEVSGWGWHSIVGLGVHENMTQPSEKDVGTSGWVLPCSEQRER